MIQIRNEEPRDYQRVEEITRKAFYNLYVPGGNEHYLVHIMRSHTDFVPELDLILGLMNSNLQIKYCFYNFHKLWFEKNRIQKSKVL